MGVRFPSLALVVIFAFCILNFAGCATPPAASVSTPQGIAGAYHCVEKGETDFSWPIIRGRVVSDFWQTVNNMINKGINIQPRKNFSVLASRCGRVIFYSPHFYGFGKTVIIDHGDGFSTLYARNSEVFVKVGDSVTKGMTIAKAGSAGRDKDIYLHFEIRKGHIPQNPYSYLP